MRDAVAFFDTHCFHLPPFAFWRPSEWDSRGPEVDEMRTCRLGWDLTDFGSGEYERKGLLLFTLRNGKTDDPAYPKAYAEKIMIVGEGQVTPWHYHAAKAEDIIVRGGGNLTLELCNAAESLELLDTPVTVSVDGTRLVLPPHSTVTLRPGESITLTRGLAHQFFAEPGTGRSLVGEVSSVNDDQTDNYFTHPAGRFPDIEEDEEPLYLLCSEYPSPGFSA